MEKKIYIVRHCSAHGQPPEAKLTKEGHIQAKKLVEFFEDRKIERIISSPYQRAVDSIKPLSVSKGLEVEVDPRLAERVLSSNDLPDWQNKLEASFLDLDIKFDGGESSREAINRIVSVVDEIFLREVENTIIVTHGNLMSLLINNFDKIFGFEEWKRLSNPDVFLIIEGSHFVERLWENER